MADERDENGELLPDEVRLTKFGKALRSTSLDELPELFNMLKGDIPLRILKMRQVFSGKMPGAFALPANEERTEKKQCFRRSTVYLQLACGRCALLPHILMPFLTALPNFLQNAFLCPESRRRRWHS